MTWRRKKSVDVTQSNYVDDAREVASKLSHAVKDLHELMDELKFSILVYAADSKVTPEMFRHIGGQAGLKAAVMSLYERVTTDPELIPYFKSTNMAILRQRQYEMFLALLGARDYMGRRLDIAHAHLNVKPEHFDRMINHVEAVIVQFGATEKESAPLLEQLRGYKGEIIGHG